MIKAVTKGRDGTFNGVILGISGENWAKLKQGKPILVRLRDMHPELPDIHVSLFGAETEADLFEDFRCLAPMVPNPHDTEPEGR